MENKKDIGKAFREKLDGLQKSPRDTMWDAIRNDLDANKRGFFQTIWDKPVTRILSIASGIILIALLGYFLGQENDLNTKNSTNNSNQTQVGGTVTNSGNTSASDAANASPCNNSTNSGKRLDNNGSFSVENNIINNDDANSSKGNRSNNTTENATVDGSDAASNTKNHITVTSGNNTKKSGSGKNRNNTTSFASDTDAASYNKNIKSTKNNFSTVGSGKSNGKRGNATKSRNDGTAYAVSQNNVARTDKKGNAFNVANVTEDLNSNTSTDSKTNIQAERDAITRSLNIRNSNNLIIVSATAEEVADCTNHSGDSLCIIKDTLAIVKTEETTEPKIVDLPTIKRWFAFVHFGPAKYNFPKNKSLIDTLLNSNSTSTKVTYNYGAYVGYHLNNKWSIRAGVIKTKLEQTTKNAVLTNQRYISNEPGNTPTEPGNNNNNLAKDYTNVNYPAGITNAIITDNLGVEYPENNVTIAEITLRQNVELLEIPVEVMYQVYGNKAGLALTGGFSMLHMSKNSIYASNQTVTMLMGSLKTANSFSFSGNAGLSFYYKLTPNLQINAEPVFKYYFNMFDGVKPYSLSLQAGLQYNFNFPKKKK